MQLKPILFPKLSNFTNVNKYYIMFKVGTLFTLNYEI